MKQALALVLWCVVAAHIGAAQTGTTAPKKPRKSTGQTSATNDELREIKSMLQTQQQQIQQLQQQVQSREQQIERLQQRLDQSQAAASQAQSQAAAAQQTASEQRDSVAAIQSNMAEMRGALTNAAVGYQDEQKKLSGLEGALNRFRFTGDIRVRYENFFQGDASPTSSFQTRNRPRVRLRFGVEGKLSEDFIGGAAVASGLLQDPTSTNETFTNAFERKTVSWDRGYITYNPQAHKWLSLTGGKFAFTWQRTGMTFDSDINPEGFSEKFAFDLKSPVVKNVTFTAMQLFFNENNAAFLGNAGAPFTDSFAVGGQVLAKLALGKRVSMTPSFSLLNFRNADILLNEAFSSQPGGTPLPVTQSGTGTFAPNGMTDLTYTGADGKLHLLSRFLYADFIDNILVKTGWEKLPLNLLLEYQQNLNAVNPCNVPAGGVPANFTACAPGDIRGDQNKAFQFDVSLGQTKNKGDFQIGYAWARQEAQSILASWGESDQRAPTNIVQNKIYAAYKLQRNTTLGYTWWVGRYLDNRLPHPGMQSGVAAGAAEPWLNRMQFDVIYAF